MAKNENGNAKEKGGQLEVVRDFQVPTILNEQDFQEELDGLTLSFTNVKIPSGGGLYFEVPGDDEEPDAVKVLEGVIVHHHPVNAFWSEAYTGGNEPPDCFSMDGKQGQGDPGKQCQYCEYNEWGSGKDGTGKACQNRRRLYLLREGEIFPLLLSLPPTSIGNFGSYLSRAILQKGLRSYGVVSEVKLKKATNKGGIEYSQAHFKLKDPLEPQVALQLKDYGRAVKAFAGGVSVQDVEGQDQSSMFEGEDVTDLV